MPEREINRLRSLSDFGSAIVDTVAALIIVLNPEGKIVLFNRACQRLTGYSFEEVRGAYLWDLFITPDEIEPVKQVFTSLAAGQFPNTFENNWVTRNGQLRLIAWSNTALVDEQGEVSYVIGTGIDITESRRMELALIHSERLYRSLFQSNQAVMLMIDPSNGQITDANQAACSLYGYTRDELLAKRITELNTLPEEQVFEKMRQAQTGFQSHFHFQHRRRDGQVMDVDVYSGPVYHEEKVYLYSIVHDVTEQRRSAERQKEYLAHLNTLIYFSKELLVERTVDSLMQKVVEAARALTGACICVAGHGFVDGEFKIGVTARDPSLPGCPPGASFTIEMGGIYLDLLREVPVLRLTDEEMRNHPSWWGLPPGHAPLRGLLGVRLVDHDGNPSGMIMASNKYDGSEFTQEDEALLVQLGAMASISYQHIIAHEEADSRTEELSTIINGMTEAVGIFNMQGALVRANPAMTAMFGFEPTGDYRNQVIPRLEIRHPDGRTISIDELPSMRALHGETIRNVSFDLINAEGREISVLASAAPVFIKGKQLGAVAVLNDVSSLRDAQDALRAYARQLERSNRDLQDFAFIASHDLQEPLRKIQSFSNRLEMRYTDVLDETAKDYLKRMQNAASRMQMMITDLLAYSRVTTKGLPFAPVDLDKVLADVLSDLEHRIEATQGTIEVGDLPVVEADATQMRQLFMNLVNNALKFHRQGEAPRVRISARLQSTDRVVLIVEDNGIGFDPQYLERIFLPFQRLNPRDAYEGTGIGLAICRKIVERHGGTISAMSEPNKGTQFIVELPRQRISK